MCEKVLQSRSSGVLLSLPGLLTSNHLNKRLERVSHSIQISTIRPKENKLEGQCAQSMGRGDSYNYRFKLYKCLNVATTTVTYRVSHFEMFLLN